MDKLDAPNPVGFTPELEAICSDICGDMGEPACWRLPKLVQPCEIITPCAQCLALISEGKVSKRWDNEPNPTHWMPLPTPPEATP